MRLTNYYKLFGPRGWYFALRAAVSKSLAEVTVRAPGTRHPLTLRLNTSDAATYQTVFGLEEYRFQPRTPPRTILDAGANIGLASVYFAHRFPQAKIIAVEPEASNFALLQRNVAPYAAIVPVQAALWCEDKPIRLVDPGLGKWGFQTFAAGDATTARNCHEVQGLTVDTLMRQYAIDRWDVLKMDIEGAEKEVFADASRWIDRVGLLIVELHERLKPGCNRSFYNASNGFAAEWVRGESIYLARDGQQPA